MQVGRNAASGGSRSNDKCSQTAGVDVDGFPVNGDARRAPGSAADGDGKRLRLAALASHVMALRNKYLWLVHGLEVERV